MKHYLLKLYAAAPAFLVAFFAPIKMLGLAIGFLVIVDIATGMWSSLKRGKPISSERLGRSVVKSIVYLLAIIVAHVAELYVMPDVPMLKVVSGIIGSTEVLSIYENLSHISGVDFKKKLASMMKPTQEEKKDR